MKPPPPGGRTPFAKTSRRCYRSAPAHGQRRCPAPSAPKSPATPRCHRSAPANCQRRCPRAAGPAKGPSPVPLASFLDPGQPSPRGLHSGGLVAVLFAPAILEDPTLAGTPQARPAQDLGAASLHRHKGLAEALALDLRQEGGKARLQRHSSAHNPHTHTQKGIPRNTDTNARSQTCLPQKNPGPVQPPWRSGAPGSWQRSSSCPSLSRPLPSVSEAPSSRRLSPSPSGFH